MRTEVDLANAALAYLQRDPNLRNLDGNTPSAIQTKMHMPQAIEEVIEEYDWPFCRVITPLIEAAAVLELPLRGWTYAYAVPSDAVIVWRVSDLLGAVMTEFELGMSADPDSTEQYIYTNYAAAAIRYGSSRVNIGAFPAQVFDLVAMRLAAKCCMPLTKDKRLFGYLRAEYPRMKSAVVTKYANLEPEIIDPEFTPELITVRSQ